MHEQMIGEEDAAHTFEYPEHFKILPAIHNWSTDAGRIKDGGRLVVLMPIQSAYALLPDVIE